MGRTRLIVLVALIAGTGVTLLACNQSPSAATATAAPGTLVGSATASARFVKRDDETCPSLQEHFTRYLLHDATHFGEISGPRYLVTQEFTIGTARCDEGSHPAELRLAAQRIDYQTGKVDPEVEWSFSTTGIAGEEWNGLYKVTRPGCCAAQDLFKYFSLATGRLVVASTGPVLMLGLKSERSSSRRFLGVQGNMSMEQLPDTRDLAMLYFGDESGTIQSFHIANEDGPDDAECFVAKLGFHPADNYPVITDGESANLVLTLDCLGDLAPIELEFRASAKGVDVGAQRNGPAVVITPAALPGN